MTHRNKQHTQKQKTTIYIISAAIGVIVAMIMVLTLVHILKNPPAVILSSNSISGFMSDNSSSSAEQIPVIDINSDAPKINGITNGATYYTTQYVTVEDKDLESVTVNGEEKGKDFFIDGNRTDIYAIEAIDANQNSTTYIVYTKPISNLLEPINHLNENTVTANDYDTLKTVKKSITQLKTAYSSQSEAADIKTALDMCEKFIKKIDSVKKEIIRIEKLVNDCEINNDHTNVSQISNDINKLLCSENLTPKQRSTLQGLDYRCQSMLSTHLETDPMY